MSRRRLLVAGAASLAWPALPAAAERTRLTLATGSSGGGFHEHGPALAELVARYAPIDLDLQPTTGSHDNVVLIGAGDADLGLASMGSVFDAWNGRTPFKARGPFRNLRALLPLYEASFGLVALRARGAARLSDLAGATIGAGPAGGSAQMYLVGLVAALGLPVKIATGAPADLAERVIAGEIDAFWFGSGIPVPAFAEVVERADGVVLGLAPDEIAGLRRTFPYVATGEIPAGSYKGQSSALPSAAIWSFLIGSDRLGEAEAYETTRAVLDHAAEITGAFPRLVGASLANVTANTFLPFHPGALRYFTDKGVIVPDALRDRG
ncbi:TAXI family TRAP transporter solute-binding subunit [uncultured Enterovirga sp.]|uniref:TAXI family TRAP transporter solute-binding subunit n=1 Tax=uncultured Enterovirga sp. TaxID=2026352 RepID=UPI0035CB0AE6